MLPESKDKRNYFRLDLRIPMRYKKLDAQPEDFRGSLMRDISAGGARMAVHEFLPLNSRLRLNIPLAAARKVIEGIARVAWINKSGLGDQYEAGMEFLNLNQGDQAQIAGYIFAKGSA